MKTSQCQIIKMWQTFKILRDLLGLKIRFFKIFLVLQKDFLGLKLFFFQTS